MGMADLPPGSRSILGFPRRAYAETSLPVGGFRGTIGRGGVWMRVGEVVSHQNMNTVVASAPSPTLPEYLLLRTSGGAIFGASQ